MKSETALSRSAWDRPDEIVATPKLAFSRIEAMRLKKLAGILKIVTVVTRMEKQQPL